MSRYDRQLRVAGFGAEGQDKLAKARVAIVGIGALGSRVAEDLGRAGVAFLRLIDRDWVELGNLHRQHLFDQADAEREEPKALAAAQRLARINDEIELDPRIANLSASNVDELLGDVDLVVDGSDNFRTRYLVNDFGVREAKPWIYGACVATQAMAAAFTPGRSCLRCIFPAPPPASATQTCESAGILPPAVAIATALQCALAFRVLLEGAPERHELLSADIARGGGVQSMRLPDESSKDCASCAHEEYPALDVTHEDVAQALCGRNAVQLEAGSGVVVDELAELAERLRAFEPELRRQMLRINIPEGRITIFRGGRAIVQGTGDVGRAQALFDRYVGS